MRCISVYVTAVYGANSNSSRLDLEHMQLDDTALSSLEFKQCELEVNRLNHASHKWPAVDGHFFDRR